MQPKFPFLQFVFLDSYLLPTLRGGWLCFAPAVSNSQQWETSWGYSSPNSSILPCTSYMAACQCPSDGSALAQTRGVFPDLGRAVHTSHDLEVQLEKDANLSLWVCFPDLQFQESTYDPWISVPLFENCCLEHLRFVHGPVFILSYLQENQIFPPPGNVVSGQ